MAAPCQLHAVVRQRLATLAGRHAYKIAIERLVNGGGCLGPLRERLVSPGAVCPGRGQRATATRRRDQPLVAYHRVVADRQAPLGGDSREALGRADSVAVQRFVPRGRGQCVQALSAEFGGLWAAWDGDGLGKGRCILLKRDGVRGRALGWEGEWYEEEQGSAGKRAHGTSPGKGTTGDGSRWPAAHTWRPRWLALSNDPA